MDKPYRLPACLLTYTAATALVCSVLAQAPSAFGSADNRPVTVQQPLPQQDDPQADGWDTEVFSGLAKQQLKQVGKLLKDPSMIDTEHVVTLVSTDFSGGPLLPSNLREVFRDGAITVHRQGPAANTDRRLHGVEGFIELLRGLADPYTDATNVRVDFKIFGVDKQANFTATQQFVTISGRLDEGSLEQNATWSCQWADEGDGNLPRLQSMALLDYEQVSVRAPHQTMFSDCTEAVLAHNPTFQSLLLRGTFDWLGKVERALGTANGGYMGLAVGDVNGDALDDVYLCQAGGLPNQLFIQNHDGTATERSAWAGVDWSDLTTSALLVDFDNDGDQDFAIGTGAGLLIMSNDGSGRFTLRTTPHPDEIVFSLAAADYDEDGDVDIFACRYFTDFLRTGDVASPIPYHDANNGAGNYLLRNDGDWQFTDVTQSSGLDVDNRRWSFAASWEDYDNDGDVDLYVANDYGRNCLYRNDNGHFVNVASTAGVEDIASGMSACWGDYNRDGHMDIYVANMYSAAGNRITYQRQFQPGMSSATKSLLQRTARGNSLFANNGDGTFVDVTVDAGVTMGRWAWSSIFVDLNNDGWEDLVVANGFLTSEDTGDL